MLLLQALLLCTVCVHVLVCSSTRFSGVSTTAEDLQAVGTSSALRGDTQPFSTVVAPGYTSSRGAWPGASVAPCPRVNVQGGQPPGPARASLCGFIFILTVVNGIEPLFICFLAICIYFSFLFLKKILFKYFLIFSIEWFCFLICFQEFFIYRGCGSFFWLRVVNAVSRAVAFLSPHPM